MPRKRHVPGYHHHPLLWEVGGCGKVVLSGHWSTVFISTGQTRKRKHSIYSHKRDFKDWFSTLIERIVVERFHPVRHLCGQRIFLGLLKLNNDSDGKGS